MNAQWKRAMLTSLILIFSSLAGCLGDDVDADDSANEDAYGTVMVSTYHVGELVKAIAGDDVVLEYMSQDNIPVHDYEPSISDLIRLENSDLFFYHGLGLEPWVESTLSSLGSKAPTSVQVHTMPDGSSTLDYESMLKTDLCDLITEGPYEDVMLGEEGSVLPEIHAEPTAQKISFPEDMHHDDEDGHDDHDEGDSGMMDDLLQLLFDEMDLDMNGNLSAEELEIMFEDEEEHHAAYASLHVRAEGEYGFALPHGVTMHILANGGHDDHGDHDEHGSMVCYNINTHTVDNMLTTEATCEDAGLIWANPDNFVQPGTDDDHDEEGHDEEGHDEEGHDDDSLKYDPHSWLDPVAFNAQTTVVMDALIAAFPDGEDAFKTNGAAFSTELVTLDTAYDAAFGTGGLCMTGGHEKKVSANHNAYSYLSVRYDIQFVTVHGLDPEGEPSPQDVAKVVEFIKEDGITVLFIEEFTDPTSVKSIVDETGVSVETLYTMELAPNDPNADYMSMMESNLANLISGMGC